MVPIINNLRAKIFFIGLLIISINLLYSNLSICLSILKDKTIKPKDGFIENKGQIIDQKNNPNPGVLYLLNTPGFNVQLRKGGFSYDLYRISNPDSYRDDQRIMKSELEKTHQFTNSPVHQFYPVSSIEYYRIDITLIGSNTACQIIASDPLPDYFNYYTAYTPDSGITKVSQYTRISYRDIYPGIDLEFLTNEEHGYKYNFVIHPGANINDIGLRIEGPEHILLNQDTLKFVSSIGDVEELIPESYYIVNDSRINIHSRFKRIENEVYGFVVNKSIPENALLVIDPTSVRLWGTYYGGSFQDGLHGVYVSVDNSGNVFLTGDTESQNNIATSGSYQDTIAGLDDGFLVKFNAAGQRQWGTYFGGTGAELVYSCITDKSNNTYVSGNTTSTSGITSPSGHQIVYGGGGDCFIEKFNKDGFRLWGTYYGGASVDDYGTLSVDYNRNVFLTGSTQSTTGIATTGSYQPNLSSSGGNAFLAKFDSNGVRQWGTYYGGEIGTGTSGYCCATDNSGNVYFGGSTSAYTNIASPGAYQTTYGGGFMDSYLAKFTSEGQRIWATYYGGTNIDVAWGCATDSTKNVCLVGETNSPNGIASTGSHQSNLGGGIDDFLVKFDSSGQRQWGTYYGGTNTEGDYSGCTIGYNGDIFMASVTSSNNNISTMNSYQQSIGGDRDAFLVKFNAAGQCQWGTYYGGSSLDYSFGGCSYVRDDTIYLSGATWSTTNISSIGAFQEVLGGYNDAMLIKFLDCWPIDTAGPVVGPVEVCEPANSVNYTIPILDHAIHYIWTLPPGVTLSAGAGTRSIFVDFSPSASSGTIWVKGLNKCGDPGDSASLFVNVHQRPVPVISGPDTICAGPGKVYSTASGKTNYQWSTSAGGVISSGGAITDNTATITWNGTGTQHVYVNYTDANGCSADTPTDYVVTVTPSPVVNITITATSNNVCSGTQVTFNSTASNEGANPVYHWQVNAINVGINSSSYSYIPLNNDLVRCILTSSITGCIMNNPDTSNTVGMIVNPILAVSLSISASANPFCQGSTITFTANPTNGGTTPSYQWKVNGGNIGGNSPVYSYVPNNGDVVSCILNSSIPCPTGNPATSNAITMVENTNVVVSVTISPSANPVCNGTSVTFQAIPTNGGTTPVYQWKVNGIIIGGNNPVYSYVPVNGDVIICILTSNAACASGNPATSNTVTMTVNPNLPVSVSITASANPVCSGTSVTFLAVAINGGTNPFYQWKVNGINVGISTNSYSYLPLTGDHIACVVTSDAICPTGNPATSNQITMTVNPNLPVSISITASANPVCSGIGVTYTAATMYGGPTPFYQWKVNGIIVGTNSSTYTYNPVSGDQILCILTSNVDCPIGNPATSNIITMNVATSPIVTFTRCNDSITTTNEQPFKLKGGIPLGGTYSGQGVTGGIFHPAIAGVGTHIINYTYTNAALCSASAIVTIVTVVPTVTNCGQILTDIRDGKTYQTVQIGSQCWLAEDLNYGTEILENMDQRDNCIPEKYHNPASSIQHPASVYQWDEIMQYDVTPGLQGLCPPGWHIPTEADWNTLFTNYISNAFAASPLKYSGFSGFNALLYGARHLNKTWDYQGFATFFWSSTSHGTDKAWAHGMNDADPSVSLYPALRSNAFSVRCLKDQ